MVARKRIDPELLAEAKRLYEQTLAPVDDICDMLGISRTPFYKRVREENWRGRRAKVATFQFVRALSSTAAAKLLPEPADQPRAEIAAAPPGTTEQQRMALSHKIYAVVADQIEAIKRISSVVKPADLSEAEHAARTMAGLSRSLREMHALTQPENKAPANDVDDQDPIPRDIDEFRFELARRIRGIIEEQRAGVDERLDEAVAEPEAE